MLSNEKTLTKVAGVLLMVFLAVFSYFVCATKVPQMSVLLAVQVVLVMQC